jgi:5-methylcytosine-specific restriction endonuclease McrA
MAQAQNSWASVPHNVREALRLQVFERDGWRCRIRGPRCTGYAEELDHIVPRHQGGALLDPDNCRAACLICNRGRRYRRRRAERPAAPGPSRDW